MHKYKPCSNFQFLKLIYKSNPNYISKSKMSTKNNLYPEVDQSNPEAQFVSSSSSSSSLYPSIEPEKVAENLFPDSEPAEQKPSFPSEETLISIPNTTVHLIDEQRSVELASGEFSIVRLGQGETIIAVLARVGDQIQWPLAKDEAAVKLDVCHYFFSLRVPSDESVGEAEGENVLNYGLTIEGGGDFDALDGILERYSLFSEGSVSGDVAGGERAAVFWTAVAPNVEEYSSGVARAIAAGSGHLAKGVLWCGEVAVDRLNWGNEYLKGRLAEGPNAEISEQALKRMKRVKKVTKMCEDVATGILSGVVKVSGFFTGYIVNSSVGKKFFSLLPGEIVLASLDGFNKVWDAVEVAGRNVMSKTSVVTTGLVSQRYGDEAAKVTNEGFNAAGHAIGTAWAVFKIRKALNPKSVIKPGTLAKVAAQANSSDLRAKYSKQQ